MAGEGAAAAGVDEPLPPDHQLKDADNTCAEKRQPSKRVKDPSGAREWNCDTPKYFNQLVQQFNFELRRFIAIVDLGVAVVSFVS